MTGEPSIAAGGFKIRSLTTSASASSGFPYALSVKLMSKNAGPVTGGFSAVLSVSDSVPGASYPEVAT